MNNKFIKDALTDFKNGIEKLEKVFEFESTIDEVQEKQVHIDTSLLAKKLAYAYTTKHPEYRVDSQFRNLKDMVNSTKISYVIAWMRRNNISEIEQFFQLTDDDKRVELNKALTMFEKEIKDIFVERFNEH